jgi:putative DNA primase/helicase
VVLPALFKEMYSMLAETDAHRRVTTARRFLRTIYMENPPGYMGLSTFEASTVTRWLPAHSFSEAADLAVELGEKQDVYLNIGLRAEDLGDKRRGTAEEVIALPGLWADIDVQGPAHKAQCLPPTKGDALKVIKGIPLSPTWIIDSGHGLQVWWLFKELWTFEGEKERQRAQELSRRFQATLQARAKEYGWRVDGTHDLARVLRIPGTYNHKLEPKEVEIAWPR